jgi:predicted RNA-binding protein associated with RNAse of E/G family
VLAGSGWSYVDLELDLVRLADGSVLLVDEDEFEQTVAEYRLPSDVVAAARTTAADLRKRLAIAVEPVMAAGWDWLDRA